MAIDTNMTAREEGDWNACTVWGVWHRKAQPYAIDDEMLDRWARITGREMPRARMSFDEEQPRVILMEAWRMRGALRNSDGRMGLVERILDTARRRHADRLLIEDKARGQDVHDEILRGSRRGEFVVQLWNPAKHGDKVSRLTATQPLFQAGLVYTPVTFDPVTGAQREFEWVQMVIDEVSAVPRGAHDDLADCVSMSMIWLRESGMLQLTEEHIRERVEARMWMGRRETVKERYGL
jgi:predicted phage terminase large subunit-like protein